jgi:diguanylate cyclase (GGDEF)-like protein
MDILKHYEYHLVWLTDLANSIKAGSKENFPELDDIACDFGKWMESEGKIVIQNNSKYKAMKKIHTNLHRFAEKIFHVIEKSEYQVLIVYLEKCELISLSIGTELALIDNIRVNKQVTKDTLTGALSRQGLRSIFQNQYEISLATGNPFILAMCDLDFFKRVNDTYGHVAGDKLLELFVQIVQKNIRNSDIVIRYGGEEFVIMLPALDKTKGYEVLESVRKAFEESVLTFNGEKLKATVSIGMIEINPECSFKPGFIDDYMMIVDQKLYIAKDCGRNMVKKS